MFDREKFKRLVHYVIAQVGSHEGFGATKLNKVLWFADARQFMLAGHSITGATYIRQKFGPVPHQIMPVRTELENEGAIKCYPPKFEYEGWRFKSVRAADANFLTSAELAIVTYWIRHIDQDHTANSISDESHDYGWDIAAMGEELPFYASMAERLRDPVGKELDWAQEVARRLSA